MFYPWIVRSLLIRQTQDILNQAWDLPYLPDGRDRTVTETGEALH